MQAPRRLQLRRGNTAAVSTYLGAPGELIINTDTNTLIVHNGSTVGGIPATVNTSAITSNISTLQSDVATLTANAGAQAGQLATLTSNAAVQAGLIADLQSNAAVQAGLIANVAGTYSNSNVKSYLSNFDGNIIPSANVTYSLGNITHQWRDLFVSNTTIYIGGVPLSINASGNLTVGGNTIPTTAYVNQQVANVTVDLSGYALNANVTAANVGMKGYVDGQISTVNSNWQANAAVQAGSIATLTANAGAQAGLIATLQSDVTTLTANAAVQAGSIATLTSNAAVQAGLISDLQSNAATQAGLIASLNFYNDSNVSTYLGDHTAKTFGGNVTIQGNLAVNGNVSYVNVLNYIVGDNIVNYAEGNPADSLDLGFVAHRTVGGTLQHTGLIRDASTNYWALFSNVTTSPTTTVDFTNAIYDDIRVGNLLSPTIDTITANLGSVAGSLATLTANAGAQAGSIATLTSNAAVQAGDIATIYANLGSVSGSIATLTSNAAVQAGLIATLQSDVTTLTANAAVQAGSIATLTANAASQADDIATIYANLGGVSNSIATLTSNAAVQAGLLAGLEANAAIQSGQIVTANTAMKGYVDAANTAMKGYVDSVSSNTSYGNANVGAYLTTYTGNIGNVLTTANVVTTQYFIGNGALLTGIVAGGSGTYSNSNVASYLSGTSAIFAGNTNILPTVQANISQVFIGSQTALTTGAGTIPNSTFLLHNVYYDAAGTSRYRNTQTGAGALIIGGAAGYQFTGATSSVTANAATGMGLWAQVTGTGISTANGLGIAASGSLTTTSGILVSGATTGNLFNTVATTVNLGGAANIINAGTTNANVIIGSGTGNVTAGYFIGNGALLTGIVSGGGTTYSNANVASYLPTYSGNVSATYFIGNGSLLTGIPSSYGNTQVAAYLGVVATNINPTTRLTYTLGEHNKEWSSAHIQDVYIKSTLQAGDGGIGYSGGNSGDILKSTGSGIAWQELKTINGNSLFGNGDITISGGGSTYGDSNVASYLTTYTGNIGNVQTTANVVTTGYFLGNGALLTGIPSSYGNTQVAQYLPTYTGNITAGNVTVTGNVIANTITNPIANANTTITAGTYTTTFDTLGNVTAQGNVVANYLFGNGAFLTGVVTSGGSSSNYSNANVAVFLSSFGSNTITTTGNVTVGNLIGTHYGNAVGTTATYTGNVTASYHIGNLTNATGNVYTVGNAIIGVSGYTVLPTTVAQLTGNANTYSQFNIQNISSGTASTTEIVATANNGNDSIFFVDLGIAGNTYNVNAPNNSLGTAIYANDAYLYAQGNTSATIGGNLAIGTSTSGKTVKIFAGGINNSSVVTTVANTGMTVTGNITASGNITATYFVTSGGYGNISQVDTITANTGVYSGNVTVSGAYGVTMPNRPAFRIYGAGSTNWTTSNTNFKGSSIVVDYNQGSYFNSTTGVFTAPVAGLYNVTLNARVGNNNGSNQIMVVKNFLTSAGNVVAMWESDTNTGTAVHYGVSSVAKLAAGDVLTANITVGAVQFDANDSWTVTYIG